jgi:hypothetical protein
MLLDSQVENRCGAELLDELVGFSSTLYNFDGERISNFPRRSSYFSNIGSA